MARNERILHLKKSDNRTCDGCIWYEQCAGTPCDDYSPASCGTEITYYESILEENAAEYRKTVLQYVDYEIDWGEYV